MSSSFLKPCVTPRTALATRLRASPWNLPSSASSRTVRATRLASSCLNAMPGGSAWRSLPFGPCTSTAPSDTCTLTPAGIGMGFLPIRDMVNSPDVAEDFAADALLARLAAGHHAARRGQDGGAQPAEHGRDVLAAEVDAAAGTADALDAGDDALAARPVLEQDADGLLHLAGLGRGVHHLEALDVAFVLENPGDLQLERRGRDVHARVPRDGGIPDARQHVGNRIGHTSLYSFLKGVSS